jgi:hypothetical protein
MKKYRRVPPFAIGLVLLIFAALSFQPSQSQQLPDSAAQPKQVDRTSLEARVKREKAKGVQRVVFSAPLVEYADEVSLKDALEQSVSVIAIVTEKHSRLLDSHTVGTFYRLTVLEELSSPNNKSCCIQNETGFPNDLPQLAQNEIYLLGMGGTVTIDGVEVTVKEDFGDLLPGQRYLFFLTKSASGKLSTSPVGPANVFRVNGSDKLESQGKTEHRLSREIVGRSVSDMKDQIRKSKVK